MKAGIAGDVDMGSLPYAWAATNLPSLHSECDMQDKGQAVKTITVDGMVRTPADSL